MFYKPGVNFINFLLAAFKSADLKSKTFLLSCQYLFTLLGSAHVTAVQKMLMKLTPEGVFHMAAQLCSMNQSQGLVAAPGKQFASGSQGL